MNYLANHRTPLANAIQMAIAAATTEDDKTYWVHELKALNDAVDAALSVKTINATPVVSSAQIPIEHLELLVLLNPVRQVMISTTPTETGVHVRFIGGSTLSVIIDPAEESRINALFNGGTSGTVRIATLARCLEAMVGAVKKANDEMQGMCHQQFDVEWHMHEGVDDLLHRAAESLEAIPARINQ